MCVYIYIYGWGLNFDPQPPRKLFLINVPCIFFARDVCDKLVWTIFKGKSQ